MTNLITIDNLRKFAEKFVAEEPVRLGTGGWWQTPLLTAAPVDARFDQLPQIAADDHLLPRDLLPTAKSVIVFYIPFKKELVKANKKGGHPCPRMGRCLCSNERSHRPVESGVGRFFK